jgi:sulfate transport system ATP-binding protein
VRADNLQVIEAVISSERYAQLQLQEGETLVLRPKHLRVFVDEAV